MQIGNIITGLVFLISSFSFGQKHTHLSNKYLTNGSLKEVYQNVSLKKLSEKLFIDLQEELKTAQDSSNLLEIYNILIDISLFQKDVKNVRKYVAEYNSLTKYKTNESLDFLIEESWAKMAEETLPKDSAQKHALFNSFIFDQYNSREFPLIEQKIKSEESKLSYASSKFFLQYIHQNINISNDSITSKDLAMLIMCKGFENEILPFKQTILKAYDRIITNGHKKYVGNGSVFDNWELQTSAPRYNGKQDDIFFIDLERGWYVNGSGDIWRTIDGGKNWAKTFNQPGTFFRCVGFVSELIGFAGNVGTEYFRGVTDTIPLYKTEDGGYSWKPVLYEGPTVKGLCALDILKVPFINHGVLDYKTIINGAGRVGSPAFLLRSFDEGKTWKSYDMSSYCSAIYDIKFLDENVGFVIAKKGTNLENSNALILKTTDGGNNWRKVYQSSRPYEVSWKCSFPTNKVGYVTVQSYDTSPDVVKRYVAKTIDGGDTWEELLLTKDKSVREFGVGFIDENTGWVGAHPFGFETTDGGKSWHKIDIGAAVNKIRIIQDKGITDVITIGSDVRKLRVN